MDSLIKFPGRESDAEPERLRAPRTISFVSALLASFFLFACVAYEILNLVRLQDKCAELRARATDLYDSLLECDEGVTSATRNFAQTGDEEYLKVRKEFVARFDGLVENLSKDFMAHTSLVDEISSVSEELYAREKQAIELAREGNTTGAIMLLGKDYESLRTQLHAALTRTLRAGSVELLNTTAQRNATLGATVTMAAGAVFLSVLAWIAVLRNLRMWRQRVTELLQERTRMVKALAESEERYTLALAGANDGIWDWDLVSNTIYYSPRWKWLLGYEEHEIGPGPAEWFSRVHSDDRRRFEEAIRDHLDGKTHLLDVEIRMVTRKGQWRWMHVRGVAVGDGKQMRRLAGSLTDITRRKIAEEDLRYGAFHDPLTGLPNRVYFLSHLERAAARSHRHPEYQFALMFLDLDGFKKVNDEFGHAAGDEFLAAVGQRLQAAIRPTDVAARIGGDEFVVLVEDVDTVRHAYEVAHRIEEALSKPVLLAGQQTSVGVSIGIVLSTHPFDDPKDLIVVADKKMYELKKARKSTQTEQ